MNASRTTTLAAFLALLHQHRPAPQRPRRMCPLPSSNWRSSSDTSGSMEGLIHQARAQLWKIVNEFQRLRRGRKGARDSSPCVFLKNKPHHLISKPNPAV